MSELDRLPWFEKGEGGAIQLVEDSCVPPVFDVHAHVGWTYGFSRPIDHTRTPQPIRYFYDYDVDQDVLFEESHPTKAEEAAFKRDLNGVLFRPGKQRSSHTAANLAVAMDRFNYRHCCLLPIEIPVHSRHTAHTFAASKIDARLIPLASVNPRSWGRRQEARLEELFKQGAPAIKFHPEFQFIAADHPDALKQFAWCAEHNVPVLAHCGSTGSEPAWLRRKSEPNRFRTALNFFPDLRLILAHTGLQCHAETLAVARDYPEQVWLDISGQAVPVIQTILKTHDRAKVMYGSDWPFYPLAVALGRALVATEECPDYRQDLLGGNAARLLHL